MRYEIPFTFHGKTNRVTVDYAAMDDPRAAAFDILNLPFAPSACRGYPMLHAHFGSLSLTGYERYCGWIQVIRREDFRGAEEQAHVSYELDVPEEVRAHGLPYFAIGYPPELFDAPCRNLRDSEKLVWRAHTFLVDVPSRINGRRLSFLAGFSWGYTENARDEVSLLDFRQLAETDWNELKDKIGLHH